MPRTGRPKKPMPATPSEAADALRAYGVQALVLPEGVFLDVPATVTLLHKLRRRKAREVSDAE